MKEKKVGNGKLYMRDLIRLIGKILTEADCNRIESTNVNVRIIPECLNT